MSGDTPLQIQQAMFSDQFWTECWEDMTGVLYWICLVCAAACHTQIVAPPAFSRSQVELALNSSLQPEIHAALEARERIPARITNANPENEATRRFFTAMAIRCSILLRFEHTDAVIIMLRRLAEVQEILRRG